MSAEELDKIHDEIVALLEGELSPDEAARVERLIASSEDYRTQYDGLRSVYSELDAMGRAFAARSQSINVLDGVMATIGGPAPENTVAFRPKRTRGIIRLGIAVAAAAAVLFAIGYVVLSRDRIESPSDPAGTGNLATSTPDSTNNVLTPFDRLAEQRHQLEQDRIERQESLKLATTDPPDVLNPVIEVDQPTMDKIRDARIEGQTKRSGIDKLVQWATLKSDTARKIAEDPDAQPLARIAAAQSLSGPEKERVLLSVVGQMQNDPYVQYELAKESIENSTATSSEPATETTAAPGAVSMATWSELDPNNALPYYLEARFRLDQGDVQGALQLLNAAGGFAEASAYALESALSQAEALIAGGMDPDTARLLSAMTAGLDEQDFLVDLGANLLEYGKQFLAANDSATAQQIFEAVQNLGEQLVQGADFSQEQLAGLEIQTQAIDVLEGLYISVESAESISELTDQTLSLVASIEQMQGFLNVLGQLLTSEGGTEFLNLLSSFMLDSGDLGITDYLADLGFAIPSPSEGGSE